MALAPIDRLNAAVLAVCPEFTLAVSGNSATLGFPNPATTAQQKSDAQAVVNGFDWSAGAHTTWQNLQDRTAALAQLADTFAGMVLRGIVGVQVDEGNLVREWIESFRAAVAGAGTLAALKTAVAALSAMPDRTLSQARTAITAKINAGTVDS